MVLALVITPIVQLYIPIVRPENELHEAGEVELTSSSRTPEQPQAVVQTIAPGAPGEPPRLIYRCYCREAIQGAYTSQYITGVAFAVTAFVKINTISYYHLRVIYCLLAMNSIIGVASNFDRDSRLRFWARSSQARVRPQSWKMIDFVYMINLVVFLAFSVYIFVKQDQNFSRCYKHNRILVFATWYWFFGLSGLTVIFGQRVRSAILWLVVFLAMAGFVAFQSWQIWVLTRTFRKKPVAQGDTDENAFTFGQILVLFMVVPLVGDFTAALMGNRTTDRILGSQALVLLTIFLVDLRRVEGRNWNDALTSFLNIFRVLIPYFVHNVVKDVRDGWRNFTHSAFVQRAVNAISAFTSKLTTFLDSDGHTQAKIEISATCITRFRRITSSRIKATTRSTRLHKTGTVRLESKEDINLSSLPASPPRSLQLSQGRDQGQEQAMNVDAHHRHATDPEDPEDPDAILPLPLPVPGSVRQRQSFPHDLPG